MGKITTSDFLKRISFRASTYQSRKMSKSDSDPTGHVSCRTLMIVARCSRLANPWQGQLNKDSAVSAVS